jgi:hypothetical protein
MTTTTAFTRVDITALRADAGPSLRRAAGALAAAAVAAYVAGEITRAALDALADRLAVLWVRLLGLEPTEALVPAPAATPEPVAPATRRRRVAPAATVKTQALAAATAPAAIAAPPLAGLTVAQLRTLASRTLGASATVGDRKIRSARRADLLEALGA